MMSSVVRPNVKPGCKCVEGQTFAGVDAEGRLLGPRTPPPVHDCDYVTARKALIPEATRKAHGVERMDNLPWNVAFGLAMERLVRERIFHRS